MMNSQMIDMTDSFNGYKLIEKRFVKEVDADCFLLEHIKSGAKILKIASDDNNKTFSIAFKTLPDSDSGTPHILEHSVLNGSKNFPVKSPFDILSKGSLNTYLNAMTADDFTIFPVASMNEKDYFNLMNVYLDAVFHPLIYTEPRIFEQEGWHYELNDIYSELEYKGVVYNEMKGSYSDPENEMWYQVQKNLFPNNGYGFSSGGHPSSIPSLTYDEFIKFHKKYYHPSNSYIFFYGNADISKELALIDQKYLSKYERAEKIDLPVHDSFDKRRETSSFYSVIEGDPIEKQTFITFNWVINRNEPEISIMLDILADVLVNHESAYIRKILKESKIGKEVYATSQNLIQKVFSIVVVNGDAKDKDQFTEIILKTLADISISKIDKEIIEGTLNRLEFRLREGNNAQKGLVYNMRSLNQWIYNNNPFAALEYENLLTKIKELIKSNYLEEIIKNELIGNSHSLVTVLSPMAGLENKIKAGIKNELAKFRESMSNSEIENIVNKTQNLIDYQKKEDSKEAIEAMPILTIEDINPSIQWYEPEKIEINRLPHLYFNAFTNGVVYLSLWFDLRVIPEEKIPYVSLLSHLLGKTDTKDYNYLQLDNQLNINTGGFNSSLQVFLPDYNDNEPIAKLRVNLKTTGAKLKNALILASGIITETLLEDKERFHELLLRHHSQLESSLFQNGFNYTAIRLESYYMKRGTFNENTRGINYYRFITDLTEKFDDSTFLSLKKELGEIYESIFTKNNLTIGITCGKDDLNTYCSLIDVLEKKLSDRPADTYKWELIPEIKNEGILTPSKVQYVIQGFDFNKTGLVWNPKWLVLNQILSTDWLQTRIRVIGGAYGGFSSFNRNGSMFFASYRDPNLKETLENFKGAIDYLKEFSADDKVMTRYIIGTIAKTDHPLTPAEKGEQSFRWYYERLTSEELQAERTAILNTSAHDIMNMAGDIAEILNKNVYCVYGNEEKLILNKELFNDLLKLH